MAPYAPEQSADHRRTMLGLKIFLVSLGVFFGALLVLYAMLRWSLPEWPPAGQPAFPILLPTLNTGVVWISSAVIHAALGALRTAKPRRFGQLMLVTANLGAVFLALQVLLFRQAVGMGLQVGSNVYSAVFFTLAGVHAVHVLVGVTALAALALMAFRAPTGRNRLIRARMWATYWHFMGAVWTIMYVALFLV
ncbi:MAG: cytochrome c oxidase subunit 3 [Myxococcales bacterium]|nr:cytochrome c oxidase subunit 3 [Myxococcales bacterium]